MILSKKQITMTLIGLGRCAGWFSPVLFPKLPKTGFLMSSSIIEKELSNIHFLVAPSTRGRELFDPSIVLYTKVQDYED